MSIQSRSPSPTLQERWSPKDDPVFDGNLGRGSFGVISPVSSQRGLSGLKEATLPESVSKDIERLTAMLGEQQRQLQAQGWAIDATRKEVEALKAKITPLNKDFSDLTDRVTQAKVTINASIAAFDQRMKDTCYGIQDLRGKYSSNEKRLCRIEGAVFNPMHFYSKPSDLTDVFKNPNH